MKRRVLHGAEAALYWSGAAWVYAAARRAIGAVVICYHSVPGPEDEPWIDPSNATPRRLFEAQMRFLARRRRVISMRDLAAALEAGRAPEPGAVVLTFDDGYRDFLTVAAPILERHALPATLFLPTAAIAQGATHWIDRLYTAFRRRTRGANGEAGAYGALATRLITADAAEREATLLEVERDFAPSSKPPRLTLNWDEVRSLRDRLPLLELGTHTVDHTDLTACSAETAAWELRQSAQEMERELGVRPEHFSFPYGRSSPAARGAVVAAGYRSALADGPDPLVRAGCDRLGIPRIEPPGSMTMLRFVTGGAYPDLPRMLFGGRA